MEKESNNKSRVQQLLEGITNWEPQNLANYIKKTHKVLGQHHLQSQNKNVTS